MTTNADGSAFLTYDTVTHQLSWTVNYRNLSSTVVAAHIHGPASLAVHDGEKARMVDSASLLD